MGILTAIKGAHPSTLPFNQPSTFELFVNAKAVKRLGIRLPQELLGATEVIE